MNVRNETVKTGWQDNVSVYIENFQETQNLFMDCALSVSRNVSFAITVKEAYEVLCYVRNLWV